MSSGHGRRVAFACTRCDEIYTRRLVDAKRTTNQFCSRRCHAGNMRTGRRMVEVPCNGCGVTFKKLPAQVGHRGSTKNYCTQACYLANVDRAMLARAGAGVPRNVPRIARFLRSQKAGLARGRNLSPERLREIAMMGVAARLAKKATRGPYRSVGRKDIKLGLEWFGPLLTRPGASSPARGCEGRTARQVTKPAGTHHEEEEVDG